MAKQPGKPSQRKVKDKWKAKGWYNLVAPEMFNRQVIGETPAEEPGKVAGRITEVTVQDLTGDFSKMHIKLQFRVEDVRGSEAHTQFVGHDMTSDYIRRLTRRKRTRTDAVVDATTKDGWRIRVKPMAITDRRIQGAKQSAIRAIMRKVIVQAAARATVGEFVKGIISGDLAKEIATACKPVQPISRVEVRKSQVLAVGEIPAAVEGAPAEVPPPPPSEGPAEEELTPEAEAPSPPEETEEIDPS
jgi:small subunit ribosomal protein S3Ae